MAQLLHIRPLHGLARAVSTAEGPSSPIARLNTLCQVPPTLGRLSVGRCPSSPGDGFAEGIHAPCKGLPGLLLQDVTTELREVHLPRHGSEPRPLGLYPTS